MQHTPCSQLHLLKRASVRQIPSFLVFLYFGQGNAYDGGQVIAEYDGSDTLLRKFIYGPGIDEPICMIDVDGPSETRYYYHLDGLGSVVALSNVNGEIVEAYSYDVFGTPTIYTAAGADGLWRTADDTMATASGIGNPYMFTGRGVSVFFIDTARLPLPACPQRICRRTYWPS